MTQTLEALARRAGWSKALRERFAYRVRNLPHRARGYAQEMYRLLGVPVVRSELRAVVTKADGTRIDLGVISRRVITTAGATFMADACMGTTEMENLNFHGTGTGTAAEATGDTTLGTEVGSRASGTQSKPSANQYRSVGTTSYTGNNAITEHGLFTASSGSTLFDRSVFSAYNVVNGDSIQWTYTVTFSAGG